MAQPRVLIVDKPEARLPFFRSVIGALDAGVISTHAGAPDLPGLLQEDYAVILVNLAAAGTAGLAAIDDIRRHPHARRTPIILITAPADAPAVQGIAGPIDCLPAPVVPETLRMKVRLFIELDAARQHEQRLRREAEELARLRDEFLATMSHELRTPLNAILGWTTLLRTGRLDAPTAERALETVERNARAQKHLLDDLLDVARIVSGKAQLELTDFDPRQALESALATMTAAATARRITLTPELAAPADPVRADFARLHQVVCNLLSNAIRFTPEGGRVWLRLERSATDLLITVTDTGQGIANDLLPHLFDRFGTEDGATSRRPSGLGLAIVRHLVALHGGVVAADSPGAGQGATFTVRIPAREPGASGPPAA